MYVLLATTYLKVCVQCTMLPSREQNFLSLKIFSSSMTVTFAVGYTITSCMCMPWPCATKCEQCEKDGKAYVE